MDVDMMINMQIISWSATRDAQPSQNLVLAWRIHIHATITYNVQDDARRVSREHST